MMQIYRSLSRTRLNDAEESICWSAELAAFIAQFYTADQLMNSTDDVCWTTSLRLQCTAALTSEQQIPALD